MTRCNRCGRALKNPRPSGYGETCERYVLGSKPKRVAAVEPPPVDRDELTPDMFGFDIEKASAYALGKLHTFIDNRAYMDAVAVRDGFRAARRALGVWA